MVDTVTASGGDGLARVAAGASARGRGRNQRGGKKQGCRGALGALQQQRRQAGGGRARAGVWRPGAPAYWREKEGDREPGGGWLGRNRSWAGAAAGRWPR